MFTTKDGTQIPFGTWFPVSERVEIQPLKTTYNIRNRLTGEIVRTRGLPAARDSIMMALYYKREPQGYISFLGWLR